MEHKEVAVTHSQLPSNLILVFITTYICPHIIIIIIIIIRPKPAYGRQGLAGQWGQDTDLAGTFWGVLNYEKPTLNLEKL